MQLHEVMECLHVTMLLCAKTCCLCVCAHPVPTLYTGVLQIGIMAVQHILSSDLKPSELEVGVVTKDKPAFR